MTPYNNLHNGVVGKQKVLVKSWRLGGTGENDRKKFAKRLCLELIKWKRGSSHPHILPICGISTDDAGLGPSLVVPFCRNGNVNEYLSRNPGANILELLCGVAAAIHHLHSFDPPIVHGKIRGSNILISDANKPLLTDLCLMNLPLPNDLTTTEGLDEVRWMAPEVVSPATFSDESDIQEEEMTSDPHKVPRASDVHSFGMTALEIYTRCPPFAHRKHPFGVIVDLTSGVRPTRPTSEPSNCPTSFKARHVGQYLSQQSISDEMWGLVTKCWAHNPWERPDIGVVESWIRVLHLQEGFVWHDGEELSTEGQILMGS